MRAMTEIEWLDGRVTKVPESAPNYDFVVNTDLITQAMPVLGGSAAFAVEVGAENELLVPTTISKVTRPSVLRKRFPEPIR